MTDTLQILRVKYGEESARDKRGYYTICKKTRLSTFYLLLLLPPFTNISFFSSIVFVRSFDALTFFFQQQSFVNSSFFLSISPLLQLEFLYSLLLLFPIDEFFSYLINLFIFIYSINTLL